MDMEKTISNAGSITALQKDLCHLILETHQAYQDDVIRSGMTYSDFMTGFFGMRKSCKDVLGLFEEHQPLIEYRFRSSVFTEEDATDMLHEMDHCISFFDRDLIDIQLRSIIPKLEKVDVIQRLTRCANTTAMFHETMNEDDMMAVLTGKSTKDYGIYNVSHFAYLMKKLEANGIMIPYWQSMVWNLSRIVYRGRYLNQHLISSTVHNISSLKRRPWLYDEIDNTLACLLRLLRTDY